MINKMNLVDLDGGVNLPNEEVTSPETDGTGKDHKSERDEEHVTKKEETRNHFDNFKLSEEVKN